MKKNRKMFNKNIFKIILTIILFLLLMYITNLALYVSGNSGIIFTSKTTHCYEEEHRNMPTPTNPYCTKCKGRDGFIRHKCENPDGEDRYCEHCGKIIVKEKIN